VGLLPLRKRLAPVFRWLSAPVRYLKGSTFYLILQEWGWFRVYGAFVQLPGCPKYLVLEVPPPHTPVAGAGFGELGPETSALPRSPFPRTRLGHPPSLSLAGVPQLRQERDCLGKTRAASRSGSQGCVVFFLLSTPPAKATQPRLSLPAPLVGTWMIWSPVASFPSRSPQPHLFGIQVCQLPSVRVSALPPPSGLISSSRTDRPIPGGPQKITPTFPPPKQEALFFSQKASYRQHQPDF